MASYLDMFPERWIAAALLILGPLVADAASLDRAMVFRVVQQRQAEYTGCYTNALSWHPGLKGRLVIRFTVEPDGQVSSAAEQIEPSGRFPDEVMAGCIADQFRSLIFPSGDQSFQIIYPMVFTENPSKDQNR